MQDILSIIGALSDESRLRIVAGLRQGELCVCQLAELVGLAQSTVSKHMFILRTAGLVESRREGKWIHYRRVTKPSTRIRKALDWIDSVIGDNPKIQADCRMIQKMIREGLCSFPNKGRIMSARSVREKEEA